jgi:long-chain fatty acid transport protein
MNITLDRRILLSLLFGMVLWPMLTRAVGYRMPNQDPEAIARGNAFVATADNPSAIYYNPAGISQLEGQNVEAGVYVVSGGYHYTSPTGVEFDNKSQLVPVPQLYYAFAPKDSAFAFGLGVYAPYGLSLDWGNNTTFNTLAEKGELLYLCINPVVAWKIHPTLSIGIGPTINYSQANFQHAIGIIPGDSFKLDGTGWDAGFNAGIRWQPHPKWALGASYRYVTTVDYHGTAETATIPPFSGSTSASAQIVFPQFVVAGVSFRPTEKWNLEFDVDWTDWDNVNQIPIQNTPLGDTALVLNYRSSFMYEFGATRQLGKGYFLSLGYFYSQNSSPDKNFTPIIPDTDLHLGSIGVGHHGKRWNWAVAYHFGYNPGRTVSGSTPSPLPLPNGQTADGTYRVFNNAINVSATIKF